MTTPFFNPPTINPYGLANVGFIASPTFADLNGDGKLDAIIGNSAGNTLVFLNTGTSTAPSFATATTNPYGLANVGFSANPTFADLNGDGTLDAIIGNKNGDTKFSSIQAQAPPPALQQLQPTLMA
jgi:uncharacterized protein (DUF2141 family)